MNHTETTIAHQLFRHPGLSAVRVDKGGKVAMTTRDPTPPNTPEILKRALDLFSAFGNSNESLRIVSGPQSNSFTTSVFSDGDATVVVMAQTGSPVTKSLRRMVQRAMKGKKFESSDEADAAQ